MNWMKKIPIPVAGLMLGLAGLGNLMQSHSMAFRYFCGISSGILGLLLLAKLLFFAPQAREELKNPAVASVFPAFTMALMILSTYVKGLSPSFAQALWYIGCMGHVLLMLWFTVVFAAKKEIKMVAPSWYIVYVGIVAASVTIGVVQMPALGQKIFYFGFLAYLVLIPIVCYKVFVVQGTPEPLRPAFAILTAPGGLLLAGYVNAFGPSGKEGLLWFLLFVAAIFYLIVLIALPKLLKSRFYPSFSGFTFPLVITAMGFKLANGYLISTGKILPGMEKVVLFQSILAAAVTLYVLLRYLQFFYEQGRQIQEKEGFKPGQASGSGK